MKVGVVVLSVEHKHKMKRSHTANSTSSKASGWVDFQVKY